MKILSALFRTPAPSALAAIVALLLGVAAYAADVQQETRAAAGFHRIEITGEADVTLVQGNTENVTIEGPSSSVARIRTRVEGGTLAVEVVESRSVWQWFSGKRASRVPHVTIRLRDVDRIEAAGAVTLDAESLKTQELRLDLAGACNLKIRDLQAASLRIEGAGATKIAIGGKVARQKVDLSGAGSYDAEKLVSDEVVVEVSGAGKAVVNASSSLAVDISGAGKVEYLGDPKIKQTISGFGKVTRREPS